MSKKLSVSETSAGYDGLLSGITNLLERGRRHAAKSVNAVLTVTYWSIGQRLVEFEQGGAERAAYGSELLKRLSRDLQNRLGRGFSERNLVSIHFTDGSSAVDIEALAAHYQNEDFWHRSMSEAEDEGSSV